MDFLKQKFLFFIVGYGEHQLSWHINSHLAAIPLSVASQLPENIATLIREAKDLHPEMAAKAAN